MPDRLAEADEATKASLGNSRVLLSKSATAELERNLKKIGGEDPDLFNKTFQAIRTSMEAGLRSVFLISATAMLLAFLLIITVPEIPLDKEVQDKKS